MSLILVGSQIVLAFTLIFAMIGKAYQPSQFMRALKDSGIPLRIVQPLAINTVILESFLATNLLFPISYLFLITTWIVTVLLLVIFTVWLIYVASRKNSLSCGCFGNTKEPVGIANVIRNSIFISIALIGLFLSYHTPSFIPSFGLWMSIPQILLAFGVAFFMNNQIQKPRRQMKRVLQSASVN